MRGLLACVAAAWLWAGNAAAATYLIDFEQYAVGETIGQFGDPFPFFANRGGVIGGDASNKYLVLNPHRNNPHIDFMRSGYRDPPDNPQCCLFEVYPTITTLDIFSSAPGAISLAYRGLCKPGPFCPLPAATFPAGFSTVTLNLTEKLGSGNLYFDVPDDPAGSLWIDNINYFYTVGAVPEPSTWAMMVVGFGLLGATLRRHAPMGRGCRRNS